MPVGNRKAPIQLYETLFEKYPDRSLAWYAKGLALSRLRIYDEAMNCFDRALSIDKNYAAAWYAKGLALSRLRIYDEAMNCFRRSLKADSKAAGGFKGHNTDVAKNR